MHVWSTRISITTHIQAHIHTHTHTYINIYIYIEYAHINTDIFMNVCIFVCILVCMWRYVYIWTLCTCENMNICIYACIQYTWSTAPMFAVLHSLVFLIGWRLSPSAFCGDGQMTSSFDSVFTTQSGVPHYIL